MAERFSVGYISGDHQHCMVGFYEPAILNHGGPDFVQVAVTIETAKQLALELNSFITMHLDEHWSDCAVNNAPALPVGECYCGGRKPS